MEIQQLRHLIAAAENRSLIKAGNTTFISQSGISRSLKTLEDRLGVELLRRGPKGIEPTVYGGVVIRRGKAILNELSRCIEELRAIEQGWIGEATIGITQNYANYLMPDLLCRLHADRPDVQVCVVCDGFLELVRKVRTEEIDFAFGLIGPLHNTDGIVIEPLTQNRSRVIVGSAHPLATKAVVTIDDLAAADWAMLGSESVQRGFSLFFGTRGRPVPSQILKSNSIALIRHFVEASGALTILPQEAVQPAIDRGVLVALDCETPVERTRIGLIFRAGGFVTPQASIVIERIRDAVATQTPADETEPHIAAE